MEINDLPVDGLNMSEKYFHYEKGKLQEQENIINTSL